MSNLQWPLFPEYAPLVSAEQNLEEFPLFELKARKRETKARVLELGFEHAAPLFCWQAGKLRSWRARR